MAKQEQIRITLRMKMLDDVFHRIIIALERLEIFLDIENNKEEKAKQFKHTAIKTERDLHDDKKNPPHRELVLGEVQLQCSALYFHTQFDDKTMFNNTMRYFLTDLLEWYGGRDENTPYNEVEMFALPIFVSLSRQIGSVSEIMEIVEKYVAKIRRIEDYSKEEKRRAVEEGFTAFMGAQNRVQEEMRQFEMSGEDVVLTAHKRGEAIDGYKRLFLAMLDLYEEGTPAKLLCKTISTYLPELSEQCLDMNEETIDSYMEKKKKKKDTEQKTENDINNIEPKL